MAAALSRLAVLLCVKPQQGLPDPRALQVPLLPPEEAAGAQVALDQTTNAAQG